MNDDNTKRNSSSLRSRLVAMDRNSLPYDVVAYLDTRYLKVIDPSDYVDIPIIRVLKKKR